MDQGKPAVSILVADDEAIILEHLCLVLSKKYPHCNIYKALDGKTGLDLFRLRAPQIVITDITMPGMSGIQMAAEIRLIQPGTKFIILTGDLQKSISEGSARDGLPFGHYIEKPVLFEKLFNAIDKCVTEINQRV